MRSSIRTDTLRDAYYRWRVNTLQAIYPRLPVRGLASPVFVLGCGRSGKSTLAALLSAHAQVVYLNEPRHLWFSAFPQSDIWTARAHARGGRIVLDETDFTAARARRLRRLFQLQALRNDGSIVVEELAINSFRIGLIRQVFPHARFIHVYRNGLEVADLIQKAAERGGWFGANQYKWKQLVEYAERGEQTRGLAAMCKDYRDMGLLEWRLSTEAVVSSLAGMSPESYVECNSAELFDHPARVLARVGRLIGLDAAADVETRAVTADNPRQRTTGRPYSEVSSHEEMLAGPMLRLSMSKAGGLVPHAIEPPTTAARQR